MAASYLWNSKPKKGVLMANQRIQVARLRKQGALVFVITGMIEAKLFVDDMERVIHELSFHTNTKK